jgi:hypothetical protein
MDIQTFANRYRLRAKRHEDGELIITGKLGHIYGHDDATLGLMFMPKRPRLGSHAKRKLEGADFTIWQDGDEEGSALFDPTNKAQARLALKVVGAKRKRSLTPAQRSAKVAILERARIAKIAVAQAS